MTVTTEQLAEWERLANEATAGPWIASDGDDRDLNYMYDVLCPVERDGNVRNRTLLQLNWNFKENLGNDREFIAASRLAVTQLVAEVRRLRGIIKSTYHEGWCDGNGYLPLPPDQATEVSAERCWDESEAKGQVDHA